MFRDPILADLHDRIELLPLIPSMHLYDDLLGSIISQQISTKAAASIKTRCIEYFGGYYFRSKLFRDIISPMCSIITRASLNNDILDRLTIYFPESIEIQKKIASILKNYDDLIRNNNRRIQILEQTAQEIYKEWFVNFRFPGYESIKMIEKGPK